MNEEPVGSGAKYTHRSSTELNPYCGLYRPRLSMDHDRFRSTLEAELSNLKRTHVLLRLIGSGSSSRVYKCKDLKTQ